MYQLGLCSIDAACSADYATTSTPWSNHFDGNQSALIGIAGAQDGHAPYSCPAEECRSGMHAVCLGTLQSWDALKCTIAIVRAVWFLVRRMKAGATALQKDLEARLKALVQRRSFMSQEVQNCLQQHSIS